ncbi:hypothetical protein ABW16_01510 [Mycolicibacter heraklionensis]|uniref:Uncharacterized protein n=1 Tax=Mycolicibacter heraklionensis TaxID=512402 RepID=A0ABR5FKJ1_9MYCO|nr:hypothetical protein [Mycolicibacter heraklionensis]KLO31548.1 hypothetical protein ABW16_01510 [Mycolicibacter heraklionensis]
MDDSINDDATNTAANRQTAERIADAPLPTRRTLRLRQSLLVQCWRFVRINLKMVGVIARGHDG